MAAPPTPGTAMSTGQPSQAATPPSPRAAIPADAWALIAALPLAQVANMALYPVAPVLRQDLQLSYSELGLVLSAFGVSRLLLDLPAASLVQRFHPRSVLLTGLVCTLVAAVLGLTAVSAWQVALARFAHGGASAIVQAVILAWLIGGSGTAIRGRVMAFSEAAFGVVSFTAPLAVGFFATSIGWRAAFILGAATTLCSLGAVARWTRPRAAREALGQSGAGGKTLAPGFAATVRTGGRLLMAAYLMTFLIFYSRQALLNTLLPLLGSDQLNLSPLEVGAAQSLLNFISIPVVLGGGWLGDRVGRRRLVIPGVVALLVTQLSLWLVGGELSYVLVSAFQSGCFLMNSVPTSLVGDALPGAARARGVVIYRFIADAAILGAPIVVGVALEAGGFEAAKLVAVAPTLAILLVLAWLVGGWRAPARMAAR